MGSFFRQRIGIGLLIVSLTGVSVLGAFYLGRFYLDIMRQGTYSGSTRVMLNQSKSVAAQDQGKLLTLNPVPVYFLQVGVFSDMEGAKIAAKPLNDLGYRPYITQTAPHKIWIGLYKNREDTEIIKRKLIEKGFSSFTGAVVVNGENLRYGKGSEALITEIRPLLENYTLWLKENLEIYHAGGADSLDSNLVQRQMTVVNNVYKAIETDSRFQTGSEIIDRRFGYIKDTVRGYKQELDALGDKITPDRYSMLQFQLLRFIDNYLILRQEIGNLSQT
ncbi:MAG TPA: SPOR domain-containing protein [Desulfobacteria bacterium]|nr:SPOR domain-containing protein [Desulfobacteria bacterium]